MTKAKLELKVIDFIQRHRLVSPGETVIVGVSGGADSVCLLHILAKWQKEPGIRLHVAHLNHQLRGMESEADAKYVSNLADSLSIPITLDKQDIAAYRTERKCSIEEAAREIRYSFLGRVAREVGANLIAIGHTRDDQVETILMHILRGTGITGLCGLISRSPIAYEKLGMSSPTNQSTLLVIRPLLDITREETKSYCQQYQLYPRIDSSNCSLSFFRNRLRLQLLPLLRQYNQSVDQALLRLADIAREDNAFIEQQVFGLWDALARQKKNAVYLDKKEVIKLPIALQRQLLKIAVAKLAGDTRDIEASHIEAARNLLSKPVGKKVSLPHGFICEGGYNDFVITRFPVGVSSTANQNQLLSICPFPPLPGEFFLKVPGKTALPGWKVVASIVGEQVTSQPLRDTRNPGERICQRNLIADFDLYKSGAELFIRRRRPGDKFQPLGMNNLKKLQDFMVDTKIPRSWRDHIPIVCSPQQIIWVVGGRIDDRVKTTETSKEILHLEFIKSE